MAAGTIAFAWLSADSLSRETGQIRRDCAGREPAAQWVPHSSNAETEVNPARFGWRWSGLRLRRLQAPE